MFRKSALAMAMLGALTTGNVVALGLGEIELKSALNQPLNAEIMLLSATDAEMQELKVAMGSPGAFEKAGVERPLFLSKIKFNVTRNDAGKPVVLITSRDVIREPFLDFLMEISWSKGRLLREYTVLVDPPLTMSANVPAVQAPAARVTPIQSAPVASQRRVRHTARLPYEALPGEYGPTQRNDTLWQIAREVRPGQDVSIEQTMLGLLRANPEAFVGNNINNLKAGYVLRVPSREDLTSVGKADARRESQAQYAQWNASRSGSVARTGSSESTVSGSAEAGEVAVGEPSLQLVAPDGDGAASATGSAAAGGDIETMQRELIMANEELEAQRRQGEDMSGRLAVLEEQIQNMQRLIQLKDNELAQLQSQAGAETVVTDDLAAVSETPVDGTTTDAMSEPVAEDAMVDDIGVDLAGADSASAAGMEGILADEPVVGDVASDVLAFVDDAETAIADSAGDMSDASVPEVSADPVAEVAPVVPVLQETATTPGLVDRLMNNPIWLGTGVAVLALLAFFGLRRKGGVETEFQESILQAAGHESSTATDSEIVATASGNSSSTSESSLLSEFAVSDMGSMRSDGEADPLAEADVYLAYGRFQQAEDLIADALEKDAENEDLNLKMLEVFQASKNQAAFDGHAELIRARLDNSDDPMWQKVAEMGREFNPENPLYLAAGAAMGAAAAAPEPMKSEEEGLDFDIDLSFEADKEQDEDKPDSVEFTPQEETTQAASPELDIDMDSVEPDAINQENTMDFDIDSLDVGGDEAEADSGDGELTNLDEVSTKLDLARAYIDMGDPDGARSILDEVIDEGSDEQKDEARGIMGQIA